MNISLSTVRTKYWPRYISTWLVTMTRTPVLYHTVYHIRNLQWPYWSRYVSYGFLLLVLLCSEWVQMWSHFRAPPNDAVHPLLLCCCLSVSVSIYACLCVCSSVCVSVYIKIFYFCGWLAICNFILEIYWLTSQTSLVWNKKSERNHRCLWM